MLLLFKSLISYISIIVLFFISSVVGSIDEKTSTDTLPDFGVNYERVVTEKNPVLCEQLPVEYEYCLKKGSGGKGPSISQSCARWNSERYSSNPRSSCLKTYMKKTYDVKACDLLKKFDTEESDNCYEYISEVKLDVNLCNQVVNTNRQIWCKAIVSLDSKVCYESVADKANKYDIAKYPRAVEICISDVVLRTQDPKPCLDISPEWGEGWKNFKNNCISNAEWTKDYAGDKKRKFCDLMEKDSGMVGDDEYERCQKNQFVTYYSGHFPPRGGIK